MALKRIKEHMIDQDFVQKVNKHTDDINDVTEQLAQTMSQKVDEVVQNGSIVAFKANGETVSTFDLSVTANVSLVQGYIDTLVSDGTIEGVALANGVVTPEKTTFIDVIENLFEGDYRSDITIPTNSTVNTIIESSTGNVRVAVVEIQPQTSYRINVSGVFNRFLVALANSLDVGTSIKRLVHTDESLTHTFKEHEFTNAEDYKYLLITVSSITEEPLLSVEKTRRNPSKEVSVFIKNHEVLFKNDDSVPHLYENLFDGHFRDDITVSSNETVNTVSSSSTGNIRCVAIKIEPNKTYSLKVTGAFDRFLVALTNSLEVGTPINRIVHSPIDQVFADKNHTFTNSGGYKYLLATVSASQQEPLVEVFEGDEIPSNGVRILIKNNELALKNEVVSGIAHIDVRENLFNGIYRNDITISAEPKVTSIYSSSGAGRTALIKIEENVKYDIGLEGSSDRFYVALSNGNTVGSPITRVLFERPRFSDEFSFTNTEGYKYLLVTVSGLSEEPSLYIHEDAQDNTKIHEEKIYINGHEVFLKEEGIDFSQAEKYSSTFTSLGIRSSTIIRVPATFENYYLECDDLMSQGEGYVTKIIRGQDGKGNNIVEYIFKKPEVENSMGFTKLKIGVLGGVHGNEKNPSVGAFNFFTKLTKNPYGNELLNKIKSMVDFHFIPVVNPSGWNANTRTNWNNVNLNRNFPTNWEMISDSDKGSAPLSELETQIVSDWMTSNSFDYLIDCHNTGQVDDVLSWISVVVGGIGEQEIKKHFWKTIAPLSVSFADRFPNFPNNTVFGVIPQSGVLSSVKDYGNELGIISCTLETAWQISYNNDGWDGRTTILFSTELFGNLIYSICKQHI